MIADPPKTLERAREDLAAEWTAKAPSTPAEILDFYRESPNLEADLEAWHETPDRRRWTEQLVFAAKQIGATCIVDIGAGAGHDLAALRAALPGANLFGVEPNRELHDRIIDARRITCYSSIEDAPIEEADLLVCVDVLEHVPAPGVFLAEIARRAKPDAVLFEATATHDHGTPLHLAANRGWHPGNTLETYGWRPIEAHGRVRIWQRLHPAKVESAGLLLCAYRSLSIPTFQSVLGLLQRAGTSWRIQVKYGDALIARSRSAILSRWYAETADDVALFVDDDIIFRPADAEHIAKLCREGHDVVCGAYPVRNGAFLACRTDTPDVAFGHDPETGEPLSPQEIRHGATGFMAIHRRVLDEMVKDLPLCHAKAEQPWWPFFDTMAVEDEAAGGWNFLSEDYYFCHRARAAGFKIWLDRTVLLKHLGVVPIGPENMTAIHAALPPDEQPW